MQSCYSDTLDGLPIREIRAITYGMPGSGSTYIWQVVDSLLGDGVVKTHSYLDAELGTPYIVTYRDPRAAYISNHRMMHGDKPLPPRAVMVSRCSEFVRHCFMCRWIAKDRNTTVLQYEQFTIDPDYMFDCLQNCLKMFIDEPTRMLLSEKHSLARNKDLSAAVAGDYDSATLLHKNHVHDGTNDSCRLFAGKQAWKELTALFLPQLRELGYSDY